MSGPILRSLTLSSLPDDLHFPLAQNLDPSALDALTQTCKSIRSILKQGLLNRQDVIFYRWMRRDIDEHFVKGVTEMKVTCYNPSPKAVEEGNTSGNLSSTSSPTPGIPTIGPHHLWTTTASLRQPYFQMQHLQLMGKAMLASSVGARFMKWSGRIDICNRHIDNDLSQQQFWQAFWALIILMEDMEKLTKALKECRQLVLGDVSALSYAEMRELGEDGKFRALCDADNVKKRIWAKRKIAALPLETAVQVWVWADAIARNVPENRALVRILRKEEPIVGGNGGMRNTALCRALLMLVGNSYKRKMWWAGTIARCCKTLGRCGDLHVGAVHIAVAVFVWIIWRQTPMHGNVR
ncbi:hypothetical protein HDV00_004831 [Rhizophlyctis rosea]|nr:hypothetical protein HDV00_004831 [Rhizophlyctis rosea]